MMKNNDHKYAALAVILLIFAAISKGFQIWYEPPSYESLEQVQGVVARIYIKERLQEHRNSIRIEIIDGIKKDILCNPTEFMPHISNIEIGSTIIALGKKHISATACNFYPWEIRGTDKVYVKYADHLKHQENSSEGLTRLIILMLSIAGICMIVEVIKFNKSKHRTR